jgi:hypothetical protein
MVPRRLHGNVTFVTAQIQRLSHRKLRKNRSEQAMTKIVEVALESIACTNNGFGGTVQISGNTLRFYVSKQSS